MFPLTSYAAANNNIDTHGSFNFHGGTLPINSETTITVDGVSYSIGQLITDINEATATIGNIGTQLSDIESTANTAYSVATTASTNAQNATNTANKAIPKSWIDVVTSSSITGVPSLNSSGYIHSPIDSSTIVHGASTTLDGKTILNVLQAIDANKTNIATNTTNISTNTANITNNAARITANAANIATNTANIAKNTNDISTIQTTANNAIPLSQKGVANGVAPLDSNGNSTAPVSTTGAVSAIAHLNQGYVSAPPTLPWTGWTDGPGHLALPSVTFNTTKQDIMSAIADNMLMAGGHNLADSVFSKFSANPYGVGDNGGCVHSVLMTFAPGTGTNCGAGGWDAVTEYEKAQNNAPWYATGSTLEDENGATHTVTFTVNGAIVRPSLPITYQNFMHKGMHVLTNIVAGPTVYSGLELDGQSDQRNQDQQFYGNTLSTWEDGSDATGTYTQFDMTGDWAPTTSGGSVDSGHIPAVGSVNNTSTSQEDSLDQVEYSAYTSPILIFGTYIKHFTRNTTCLVQAASGDTGGGLAMHLGASRKCDEELDNWYYGPDYGATMHGLTIGYGGNYPSSDSYGVSVAGNWPEGYRSWLGASGRDFDGDEFKLGQRQGPSATLNEKAMIAEWWQSPSTNSGYLESVKLWSQVDSISGNSGNPNSANGQDISYWFGPRQNASSFKIDGQFESAISFNPSWSKNGVALCGSNAAGYFGLSNAGTACLTVDDWGNSSVTGALTVSGDSTFSSMTVNGNLSLGEGKAFYLPSSGYSDTPFLVGLSNNTIALANNAGEYVGFRANGNNYFGTTSITGTLTATQGITASGFTGTLSTPSSSTADCTAGQFQDDADYHYVCTATNNWKRIALDTFIPTTYTYSTLPSSPNTSDHYYCTDCYSKLRESGDTETGIEVNWNGTRWNDPVGIEVQH